MTITKSCLAQSKLLLLCSILLLSACATTSPGGFQSTVLQSRQDPFALAAKADDAYAIGDWLTAERYYQALTRNVPNDAYAWTRLGTVKLRQNNFVAAIHAYQRALERNADDPRTHFNLATAHLLQARDSLQKARTKLPEDDAAIAVIEEKLKHFEALVYGPIVEVASPTEGLINQTPGN
jgi:tetratricopeptide (TPR) repeat protein